MISKPPVVDRSEDWPLVRGLWRAFVILTKALMLGFLGLWVLGLAAAVLTLYCYMIGVYLGLPLGFALGVILSFRVRAADVLFTFGFSVTTWVILARVIRVPADSAPDVLFYQALPPMLGAAVAVLIFATRGFIPYSWKQAIGLVLSLSLAALAVGSFLVRIYT